MDNISSSGDSQNKPRRGFLLGFVIVLLTVVFIAGLRWIFSLSADAIGNSPFLAFDYAVGLTMIFLPCTLPLAFVIVPLAMGKSYAKGIGMALSFGIGVLITLSVYGILIGLFGQALGISRVETAKNILYVLAGAFAVFFALGELGLTRFRMPTFDVAVPRFIQNQKDFLRAGLLGLFLGNVGVGCPNPLFNAIIIPQIIALGSPFQGFIIMMVQALGRITPLLILAFLAVLGFNATKFLVSRQGAVLKLVGWSTVFIGGFLLTLGLFTHDWWVYSGMHSALEFITQENLITHILAGKVSGLGHIHEIPSGKGLFGQPLEWGTPFMLFLWIFPMYWYWLKNREAAKKQYFNLMFWFIIIFSILLIAVFGYLLPDQFIARWSKQEESAQDVRGSALISRPVKPVDVNDISRKANDIAPPITRKENQRIVVNLEAKEVVAELAPGTTYTYWTYNSAVPGPFIRVKEGDTIEIQLTHPEEAGSHGHTEAHSDEAEGSHGAAGHAKHSIDLHAVEGPGGGAVLTQVAPGETKRFEFKATRPGIYVYHCASPHIPTHVANGMYGLILVEPKNGLSKVDKEFYVMQGEFYTKGRFGEKRHQEFSLDKLQSEEPEYFVFNGKVGSLTGGEALRVKVGETIRLFFGVGSHIASNFHIIGGILDKLYPEGDIISSPHRNVQTTIVPPGGAAMIEFKLESPGKYLLVDHSLSRAIDKGALGEIIAEGEDHPEIFKGL